MQVMHADIAGDRQALGLRGTHRRHAARGGKPAQVHTRAGGTHEFDDRRQRDGLGERRNTREPETCGHLAIVRDATAR